jgi:hypothetical protein
VVDRAKSGSQVAVDKLEKALDVSRLGVGLELEVATAEEPIGGYRLVEEAVARANRLARSTDSTSCGVSPTG